MTFSEYVRLREGLWLNDKNALPGMSRLNTLPTRKASKQSATVKTIHASPSVPQILTPAVGRVDAR